MQSKLFPNIRKITSIFCVSILCITLTVLTLRLTAFSDMAAAPESVESSVQPSDTAYCEILNKIYFADVHSKGDIFLSNLSEDKLIKVNIVLADSGESILSTQFVNPGGSRKSDKLNPVGQKLEDRVYDCLVEVLTYNKDNVTKVVDSDEMEIQVYIGQKPKR